MSKRTRKNTLPDAAFAVVSPNGTRHFPHHSPEVEKGTDQETLDVEKLRDSIKHLPGSKLPRKMKARAARHLGRHWRNACKAGLVSKDLSVENSLALVQGELSSAIKTGVKKGASGTGAIFMFETGAVAESLALTKAGLDPKPVDSDFVKLMSDLGSPDVLREIMVGDDRGIRDRVNTAIARRKEAGDQESLRLLAEHAPVARRTVVALIPAGAEKGFAMVSVEPDNQYRYNPVSKLVDGFVSRVQLGCSSLGPFPSDWIGMEKSTPVPPGVGFHFDNDPKLWGRVTKVADFRWAAGPQTPTKKSFLANGDSFTGLIEFNDEDGNLSFALDRVTPAELSKALSLKAATDESAESAYRKPVTFEILKKKTYDRLVTGIALIPEQVDAQGDIYSARVIQNSAHSYLARYNKSSTTGINHEDIGRSDDVPIVESWLLPKKMSVGGKEYPKGTWVVTVKVLDDDVWFDVLAGNLTGFSIGGMAVGVPAR